MERLVGIILVLPIADVEGQKNVVQPERQEDI